MTKYRLRLSKSKPWTRAWSSWAADGLEYHLRPGVTGNTRQAHELVHLVGHEHRDAVLERFYRGTSPRPLRVRPESLCRWPRMPARPRRVARALDQGTSQPP